MIQAYREVTSFGVGSLAEAQVPKYCLLTSTVIRKEMLDLSKSSFLKMFIILWWQFCCQAFTGSAWKETLFKLAEKTWEEMPFFLCWQFAGLMKLFPADLNPQIHFLPFPVSPFHLKCSKCFLACFFPPCLGQVFQFFFPVVKTAVMVLLYFSKACCICWSHVQFSTASCFSHPI